MSAYSIMEPTPVVTVVTALPITTEIQFKLKITTPSP